MVYLVIFINVTISPVKINIFRAIFKIIFHCGWKNNTLIIYDWMSKALLDKTQSKCLISMQSVVLNGIEQSSGLSIILNAWLIIVAFHLNPLNWKVGGWHHQLTTPLQSICFCLYLIHGHTKQEYARMI